MKNHDQQLFYLKEHMSNNNLLSSEEIIVDDEPHEYQVIRNGKLEDAYYIAMHDYVGKHGPRLICFYGLRNEVEKFRYLLDNRRKR